MVLIVTGYSPGYRDHAHELGLDCERLGLGLELVPYEDKGDWAKNCLHKATVIAQAMLALCEPLIWIDADAKLFKVPKMPDEDFAAAPSRANIGRVWSGGTICLRPGALEFVLEWRDACEHCSTDEEALNMAWGLSKVLPSFTALPKEYAWMPVDGKPGPDVIIQHRLSGNAGRFRRRT